MMSEGVKSVKAQVLTLFLLQLANIFHLARIRCAEFNKIYIFFIIKKSQSVCNIVILYCIKPVYSLIDFPVTFGTGLSVC